MVTHGLIKNVLSQNVDNLHLKAGLTKGKLVEVHGNICKEYCEGCGREYYRNYYCRERARVKDGDHYNGRGCGGCGGRLMDSLVFFGESYREAIRSRLEQLKPDMIVAVGTSLTIPFLQRFIKKSCA